MEDPQTEPRKLPIWPAGAYHAPDRPDVERLPEYLDSLADHLRPFVVERGGSMSIASPFFVDLDLRAKAAALGVAPAVLANLTEAENRAMARLAWATRDYEDFLARHTSDFQADALMKVFERCGAVPFDPDAVLTEDLSRIARSVWDWWFIGMPPNRRAEWIWMLGVLQRSGQSLMNVEELAAFEALPANLTIYRGFWTFSHEKIEDIARGFWWTLDRNFAENWALGRNEAFIGRTHGVFTDSEAYLAATTIPRHQAHGLLAKHYAAPIVMLPENLGEVAIERLSDAPMTLQA